MKFDTHASYVEQYDQFQTNLRRFIAIALDSAISREIIEV